VPRTGSQQYTNGKANDVGQRTSEPSIEVMQRHNGDACHELYPTYRKQRFDA
jgi:hypothetical protein